MVLKTSESAFTDVPFVPNIEDYLFAERIERAHRQLTTNSNNVPDIFEMLNRHVVDRM